MAARQTKPQSKDEAATAVVSKLGEASTSKRGKTTTKLTNGIVREDY